jgi:hypothetical protein
MIVSNRATRSMRRLAWGVVVALVAAALVPAIASAEKLWEGKWKYQVEGGGRGKMCLKQDGDDVYGKFQASDPGKHGTIGGTLTQRQQNWNGGYRDRGTGDKGKFHAAQGEADHFAGWFKSNSGDTKYDWGGQRIDENIGYAACVASIKDD